MRNLLYALLIGLLTAGCADLDYVDDYLDSTFYDESEEDEYVEVEDDEYAQDVVDEEVVEIATTLKKDEVGNDKSTDLSEYNADDEIVEETIKEVAQPQPTQSLSQPKQVSQSKPTKQTQTTQSMLSPRPMAVQNSQGKSSKIVYGRGLNGLFQSTIKLKSQCESKGNIRECEDLGRIYALKEKRDLAITYYDKACDNGNGSPLSCFFASRIYNDSGDSVSAQGYLDALNDIEVKVKNLELNLSTLKVAKAKRNLKMSCTEGNEGACKTLQNIFKIRGEKSEMRTYFGTECWRGSALGCEILRSM